MTQDIVVEGGRVHISGRGGLRFDPNEGQIIYLTVYDMAELLRFASGSDGQALKALAQVMESGHRFTDDPDPGHLSEDPW